MVMMNFTEKVKRALYKSFKERITSKLAEKWSWPILLDI
jgi:hypothetical protein